MIWSKSSSSKGLTCFEAMSDRSEYDRRYAIDASKLCGEFGWRSMLTTLRLTCVKLLSDMPRIGIGGRG